MSNWFVINISTDFAEKCSNINETKWTCCYYKIYKKDVMVNNLKNHSLVRETKDIRYSNLKNLWQLKNISFKSNCDEVNYIYSSSALAL